MTARWTKDRPISIQKFMAKFHDEEACAIYLENKRWPDGFVCHDCGSMDGYRLANKKWTWRCRDCSHQTSITAGTIMHGSHLPLRTWFLASHLVATHSNGISAVQLQAQLGIGSYKSAWFLLHRLRKAMVNPDRSPLEDVIEVDETSIPYHRKTEPVGGGQGRSPKGKIVVAGAVEVHEDGSPGRVRLSVIPDFTRETLHGFVEKATVKGALISTDGNSSYNGVADRLHYAKVIGDMPAHVFMSWIHRVFANLKRWGLGVYHGFRKKYLQAYLDEYAFRWNRRQHFSVSFDSLLGIGVGIGPMPLKRLVTGS